MSRKKSIVVTVIFAVMLAAITIGMRSLFPAGYAVIMNALSGVGFYKLACLFDRWLSHTDETPLSLPEMSAKPVMDDDEDYTADEIVAEMKGA